MFYHNFKYTLKILLRNKSLIFWVLLFPIILGTFFYLAFMDIEKNDKFVPINIGIIDNLNYQSDEFFSTTFELLGSSETENQIFNISYIDLDEAENLLKNDEIIGYLEVLEEVSIKVKENGINETIFKNVVLQVLENKKIFQELLTKRLENFDTNTDISALTNELIEEINEKNINIKDTTSNNLSYMMIEFYTLIAMTCLYGGILGVYIINRLLPNITSIGKRVGVSNVSKKYLIFSSLLATYLVEVLSLVLLFIYTTFVLNISYGNNLFLIILTSLIGALAGLSLGIFIGVLKVKENTKNGLVIAFTMLGCFLSGMMGVTMKYIIDKNIPILNKINPANMITDAFYSLYYYGVSKRFYFNLISLIIFSSILIIISIKTLRRNVYDSI